MSLVFHLSVLLTCLLAVCYSNTSVDFGRLIVNRQSMPSLPFHVNFVFFTTWTAVVVAKFHAVAFLNELFGDNENYYNHRGKIPLLRQAKDSMFSLALPLSLYVSVAYWSLRTIDRNYVDPEELELPLWLNHILHSFGALANVLELCAGRRGAQSWGRALVMAVTVGYVSVTLYFYYMHGVWLYPFLALMPHPLNVLFVLANAAGIYVIHLIIEKYDRQMSICSMDREKDD